MTEAVFKVVEGMTEFSIQLGHCMFSELLGDATQTEEFGVSSLHYVSFGAIGGSLNDLQERR